MTADAVSPDLECGLTATLTIMVADLSNPRLSGEERWVIYLDACRKLASHFRHHGWTPPTAESEAEE